jgi:hypothetical protein
VGTPVCWGTSGRAIAWPVACRIRSFRGAWPSGNRSEAANWLGVSLRTIEPADRLPLVHVEGAAHVRVTELEADVQGLESDRRTTYSRAEEE